MDRMDSYGCIREFVFLETTCRIALGASIRGAFVGGLWHYHSRLAGRSGEHGCSHRGCLFVTSKQAFISTMMEAG